MSAAFHRNAADGACQKGIFATLSNETHFVGLSFEKAAARRSALAYARTFASLAIDRQENMRFCRAEMPSYGVKALENTQSILCGLFLVCEHFSSGRTASHRAALDFRGIFVLLDAGGLSPAKEKRAKSTEKTYLSDAWVSCPSMAYFLRRTCRRRKWLKLYLRLRAQTLRGFFDSLKDGPQTVFFLTKPLRAYSPWRCRILWWGRSRAHA